MSPCPNQTPASSRPVVRSGKRSVSFLAAVCGLACTLVGCGSGSPVKPTETTSDGGVVAASTLPVLGSCSVSPNYASGIMLSRWAGLSTGLGITVSINVDRSLPGLSSIAADNYADGARFGANLWQGSMVRRTGWRLPDLQISTNNPSAQIQVTLTDTVEPGSGSAVGATRYIDGTASGRTVITGALIMLQRPNLKGAELLLANRVWSQLTFNAYVAHVIAHEFGHALGIRGHSPSSTDLMSAGGNRGNGEVDFENWITSADANTLSHAYCR